MEGFIYYTFKPYVGFSLVLINLIVTALLTMCYFANSPFWFLIVIACYCSLLTIVVLAGWYYYTKYLHREAANTLRNLHRTWKN